MGKGRSPLSIALDILTRRDHSETELALKLRRSGIGEEDIEALLVRLRELGCLDDHRLAYRIAESALAEGRVVGERLLGKLLRRGIRRDLAVEAVARASEGHNLQENVREIMARKFPGFDPAVAGIGERRRLVEWFRRRGYPLSAILEAMKIPPEE